LRNLIITKTSERDAAVVTLTWLAASEGASIGLPTLLSVTLTIAQPSLAALFFVDAGATQSLAVGKTPAALPAIAPTIALTYLSSLFFVDAGASQPLTVAATPILHVHNEALREAGAACVSSNRCSDRVCNADKSQADHEDHGTDHS
jgi:hypothetical protein